PAIEMHLRYVIPTVGTLVSGSSYAYDYLPQSSKAFMTPEELAGAFRVAGLRLVRFKQLMFGTVAIHVGVK
ncbi:MAG: class I SAM-dependent methyltransferase, partial [Anaerolineae bacterium]|nr:class I SAM-dependent methyltransferase [Anaerolineae bacterium]MCB0236688.1 class I SAM-dependent methyltransferase [Anaerolineae bacterium]